MLHRVPLARWEGSRFAAQNKDVHPNRLRSTGGRQPAQAGTRQASEQSKYVPVTGHRGTVPSGFDREPAQKNPEGRRPGLRQVS